MQNLLLQMESRLSVNYYQTNEAQRIYIREGGFMPHEFCFPQYVSSQFPGMQLWHDFINTLPIWPW